MINRLNTIEEKYEDLNNELSKPEVISNFNETKKLLKEQKSLEETVLKYREYKKVLKDLEEAKEMKDDPELSDFVSEEMDRLNNLKEKIESELEILLVPKDPNDGKDIIMEIRGAAGGDEANIFAGDLFKMYSKYIERQGWKIEIVNATEGSSGGFSQIEFYVKGENVYSLLKYESGSHRVQRVPETETQGRVHTSTSTVAVIPESEEIDIELKDSDIRMDVYHSSGAGGQSVNTSDSAVRLTHIPTGVVVACQTERSQLKNRERAMTMLKTKIQNEIDRKREEEIGAERKNKVGTGDRSEKIRTYNYPQNRVTDHRINFSVMELDKVMNGYLDEIIEALINEDLKLKLTGE